MKATNDRAWGRTEYQANRNGQITAVLNARTGSELYGYDSQQNLTQKAVTETDDFGQLNHAAANDPRYRLKQHHGRTVRFGNTTYKYDTFGRLKAKTETKHGFRPITTFYKWNSQNQLVEFQSPFKGTWRYEYDSFGRRICKYQIPQENQPLATEIPVKLNQRFWRKQLGKPIPTVDFPAKGTQFIYHHNQLVAEVPLQADGNTALAENWEEAIYWLYQDDDFTPTARLHKGELHYTVSDQIGTITELMSENGYIHYRQKLNLWGEAQSETLHHQRASNDEIICNHRFVGQYYDEESGLHYNRFRYYSPETGQYVSADPIGLLGGFNPYGYVFNPTGWVDSLGLSRYDGVSFEGSSDLYPVSPGQKNTIKIQVQGTRYYDFKEANLKAGFGDSAYSHPQGYTWHHRKDFDPNTNTTTLELVKTKAHIGTFPHSGSPSEFSEYYGVKYDTPEAREIAQRENDKIAKNQSNKKC